MIALVFFVIFFLRLEIDKKKLFLFISVITGLALQAKIAFASATKVRSGIITSSFSFIPNAFNDKCNAAVPFETATAYFDFVYLEKSLSNLSNCGPSVSIFCPSALSTIFLSSFEIHGSYAGYFIAESPKKSFFIF